MENPNLLDNLHSYGADTSCVKTRFMGNTALYTKCFYALLQEPNFTALRTAMAVEQYQAAFEAAHAMKGLSGNLGLTPLYKLLCALVESLRAGHFEDAKQEYTDVEDQLVLLNVLAANQ